MNKQLRHLTRTIFVMFLGLFVALSMLQVVRGDALRAHPLNERTNRNAFNVERGAILVNDSPIAYSQPSNDIYKFNRVYTDSNLYSPITGYFSHYQGATGIEQAMNEQLSGLHSNQFFSRLTRIFSGQSPQGSSVALTLNPQAQKVAQDAFTSQGMKGAAVAMDPTTGEILAMVSAPNFDANHLAVHDDAQIISNYNSLLADPNKPLVNRAIAGDLYHPGSVFKILTSAAAIESGSIKPDTKVPDTETWRLPGTNSDLRNASRTTCAGEEEVTLETAFVRSCNIPFAEIVNKLPDNALQKTAAAFGFGKDLQIPLSVTNSTVGEPSDAGQRALTAIGQYDVRVTPLQIAMMTSAIANEGKIMKPTLVSEVITPDLQVVQKHEPSVWATPVSKQTADSVKTMMQHGVTDAAGLARGAAISGAAVGGKTGTAETGIDANGESLPYNLWFTGFAERNGKKVVVAVVVEDGGGEAYGNAGGSNVVPTTIGKQIMEAVLTQ